MIANLPGFGSSSLILSSAVMRAFGSALRDAARHSTIVGLIVDDDGEDGRTTEAMVKGNKTKDALR